MSLWLGFYYGIRSLPGAETRQSRWIIGSAVVAAACFADAPHYGMDAARA